MNYTSPFLLIILLLVSQLGFSQDVFLDSQSDVNAFNASTTTITGDFILMDSSSTDPFTDLSNLANITNVTNDFIISGSIFSLTGFDNVDLSALSNIQTVGRDLIIEYTSGLTNIDGLSSLVSVGQDIDIYQNVALTNLNGLHNVSGNIRYLDISNNANLAMVDLPSISSVGDIFIYENGISVISGFDSLERVTESFNIETNPSLVEVSGFDNLKSVGSNSTEEFSIRQNGGDWGLGVEISGFSSLDSINAFLTMGSNSGLIINNAFNNLTFVDDISLRDIDSVEGFSSLSEIGSAFNIIDTKLANLDAFSSLISVGYEIRITLNDSLVNIDGLSNVTNSLSFLFVSDNPNLSDCCGIQQIVNANVGVTFVQIFNNNFNCLSESDVFNATCYTSELIDTLVNINCVTDTGIIAIHPFNGLEPFSYSWSNGAVDSVIYPTSGGIYSVVITDANGVSDSLSVLVAEAISPNGIDLNANLIAPPFRPGFLATIAIDAYNDGCVPQSGNVQLILDTLLSYQSANNPPDFVNGDTLTWNFTNINFNSGHLQSLISTLVSTNATIGDDICFELIINPFIGDSDTTNNRKTYCFPVLNGYDPNDKQAYPQGVCAANFIGKDEKITYTIRFQNTGNADAINIYLLDPLDDNLDPNSIRVIAQSHEALVTELLPSNVLKFQFDSIMLPDSTTNEELSNGFVMFEVEPLPGLADGATIENNADIYFDFNESIRTNTVNHTLMDEVPASSSSTLNVTACNSYIFNSTTYSSSGVYSQFLTNTAGCDSIITLNLNIENFSAINEINDTILDGEFYTLPSGLMVTQPGSYNDTVISNTSCDTVYLVNLTVSVGILSADNINLNWSVYPNPTSNKVTIEIAEFTETYIIEIRNVLGQLIETKLMDSSMMILPTASWSTGVYSFVLKGNNGMTLDAKKLVVYQ